MRAIILVAATVCALVWPSGPAAAAWYTTAPAVLRQRPGSGPVIRRLSANETVHRLAERGAYIEFETLSGARGFVIRQRLSNRWLRVLKAERRLELMEGSWTVGRHTASMDLLGKSYPTVVGHFRLTHPFDY